MKMKLIMFTTTVFCMIAVAGWWKEAPAVTVMRYTTAQGKARWVYSEAGKPDKCGDWTADGVVGSTKYITEPIKDWIPNVPIKKFDVKPKSRQKVRVWVQWPIEGDD